MFICDAAVYFQCMGVRYEYIDAINSHSPLQSVTGELLDVIGSTAIQIDGMSTSITVTVARMLNIKYEHQTHIICRTKLSRLDDAR